MKIGILTFQCSHNYGAMLQAYALQEYFRRCGHDVYMIDYRPKYKLNMYKKFNYKYWVSRNIKKCIQRLIHEIRVKPIRIKRWNNFNLFSDNYFNLYPYKHKSFFEDFDLIVIGSDQVWNPKLTGGNLDTHFLGDGFKCPYASYAASSKFLDYTEKECDIFRNLLNNFIGLSVREQNLQKKLQPFSPKQIELVLDPTLLAGRDVYKNITSSYNIPSDKYILLYEIHRHEKVRELAKLIAKERKYTVIELVSQPMTKNESEFTIFPTASPGDFIHIIKNSSFVITTSFHGLALSLIFEKDFYAVKQHNSADDRLSNLLKLVGLQDRFIDSLHNINYSSVNYNNVNELLLKERVKSDKYIQKIIQLVNDR